MSNDTNQALNKILDAAIAKMDELMQPGNVGNVDKMVLDAITSTIEIAMKTVVKLKALEAISEMDFDNEENLQYVIETILAN